jgi:CheY-like chemotaxis protein
MQQPTVVAVIDDLFFQAKVGTALQQLGIAVQVVPNGATLLASLQSGSAPALVIVDLTLRSADATSLIRELRALPCGDSVPILAFGSHVAVEVQKQALQAGASQVVAKSAFAKHLPQLVRQFVPRIIENHTACEPRDTAEDRAC